MRDIEGIEHVSAKLAPHWTAIERHFEDENAVSSRWCQRHATRWRVCSSVT
jgi:hypothetical protein